MHTDYEVDVYEATGEKFTCYATYNTGYFAEPEAWLPVLTKELISDGFDAPFTFGPVRATEDDK